jgi:hypothetical protein
MVTIVDYKKRENAEGKEFMSLTVEGDVELIKSSKTGKFYATAKRTSIVSTFDEETCKRIVGKSIPGAIVKVESEPYEYEIPGSSGETVTLNHKYEYRPVTGSTEEAVFS